MIKRVGMVAGLWLVFLFVGDASAQTGRALIAGTTEDSQVLGEVQFTDTPEGLQMIAHLKDIAPGEHGFHIHEFGLCTDFGKAAGNHYNPMSAKHGQLIKEGFQAAHAGDLGNITVGSDGTGSLELNIPGLSLSAGPYPIAGRSVILHANPDDFSQPLGNAGSRIGCGVIVITGS